MLIIGIDEGLANTGICLLRFNKADRANVIYATHFKTKTTLTIEDRLQLIYRQLSHVYDKFHRPNEPVLIATEELFMGDTKNGLNCRSTTIIKTAMVYGVISLFCADYQLTKIGIPPATVKKRCTGNGKAHKEDVMSVIRRRFRKNAEFKSDHVCDAAAIALTAYELWKEMNHENTGEL